MQCTNYDICNLFKLQKILIIQINSDTVLKSQIANSKLSNKGDLTKLNRARGS